MREMKDSGVEWIGEIPEKWELKRIKHLFTIISGATPGNDADNWDGDILWITPADYKTIDKYVSQGKRNLTKKGLASCSTSLIPAGNIIFSKRAPIGTVAINARELCTNQGCLSCIAKVELSSKFYYYVLSVGTEYFELLGTGTTFKEISANNFANCKLPFPSLQDQDRIAEFLDAKCAESDALTADIQAQIDTLEQYKRSVITEAVTKGQNPDAKMRDSGNEWVGKIPSNWQMIRVLYILEMPITDGPHTTPELFDEGIPFVSAEAVSFGKGSIDFEHIRGYISQDFYEECCKKYIPRINDLFMIKSGATTGTISMVDTDIKFTIWSPLAVFRSDKTKIIPKFLYYSLYADYFQKQVQLGWSYGTQQNIGMRVLEHLKICFPPLSEQQNIVKYLDAKCAEIDTTIADKQVQLETLADYKKSLIFEYVTGKKEVPAS